MGLDHSERLELFAGLEQPGIIVDANMARTPKMDMAPIGFDGLLVDNPRSTKLRRPKRRRFNEQKVVEHRRFMAKSVNDEGSVEYRIDSGG